MFTRWHNRDARSNYYSLISLEGKIFPLDTVLLTTGKIYFLKFSLIFQESASLVSVRTKTVLLKVGPEGQL